jgi:hypothetical protein
LALIISGRKRLSIFKKPPLRRSVDLRFCQKKRFEDFENARFENARFENAREKSGE